MAYPLNKNPLQMFQHTAARRRLAAAPINDIMNIGSFNTQPPEGGWRTSRGAYSCNVKFQHTAARRRLGVSALMAEVQSCFNTQPPEGGWR